MTKLSKAFRSIKPFSALVVGDFFVDTYTSGRVKRISPEAPVQVLEVDSQESRPGGAGNAAKNIAAIGGSVKVLGRIGDDLEGLGLQAELLKSGIDASTLILEPCYKTPVKNRLLAGSQQLLRVDFETIVPLHDALYPNVLDLLRKTIPTVQVVALSDYGKGFLTEPIIAAAIQIAKEYNIPLIVDPKGTDFSKYRGATLLKPNLSEAYAASKLPSKSSLDDVAHTLLQNTQVDQLLITRSEAGISLFDANCKREDFPVQSKEVKDVTGAGDTVLAMMSLALANQLELASATQLANIAAGLAIERLGCVQVTLPEIASRLLELNDASKIFDEIHTHALAEMLKNHRYILLIIDQTQELTNAFLRQVRHLAQSQPEELLVYIQGTTPNADFLHLLSKLSEIDFILLQTDHLDEFQPEAIYLSKNEHLQKISEDKEILQTLLIERVLAN